MSTHYVCGCTSEDCRVNGCLMKRQRNEAARFYSIDSADCGCNTISGGSVNIKVLTDEQIETFFREHDDLYAFCHAIEQAVLQSPEVQGLLNALQEVVDAADGEGWKVLDPSFEKQRAALAAMGK